MYHLKIHHTDTLMNTLHFSSASAASVHIFSSLESVALDTLPYLQHGTVGFSGGTTYKTLFSLWAQKKPNCSDASFFPVDERLVPFDDPASNWGAAYRLFLNPVGKSSNKTHAALSAKQYNNLLHSHFSTVPPVFDVIFLGMGSDGHTAGIFPGTPHVVNPAIRVLETTSPVAPIQRISLSMTVLAAAKNLIVVIAGAEKTAAVAGILNNNNVLPIVQVLSQRSNSIVYIERQVYSAGQRNI